MHRVTAIFMGLAFAACHGSSEGSAASSVSGTIGSSGSVSTATTGSGSSGPSGSTGAGTTGTTTSSSSSATTATSGGSGSGSSSGSGGTTGATCLGDGDYCPDGQCCPGEVCGVYQFVLTGSCCVDFGGSCGPGATCCAPAVCASGTCVTPTWDDGGDLDLGCAQPIGCVAPSTCEQYSGTDTRASRCRLPDGDACVLSNDDCTSPYNDSDRVSCCASGLCDGGVCACLGDQQPCTGSVACCGTEVCELGASASICCVPEGSACSSGATCCGPMVCDNGVCAPPQWPDGGRLDVACSAFSGCDPGADCTLLDPSRPDAGLYCLEVPGQPCGETCPNPASNALPNGSCCANGVCTGAGVCG